MTDAEKRRRAIGVLDYFIAAYAWQSDEAEDMGYALELLKAQQWISVEERLPDPFEVVLISILSKNGYGEPATIESLGCYEHGEWKCFVSGICEGERVTHWMPMPKPPKDGEQE